MLPKKDIQKQRRGNASLKGNQQESFWGFLDLGMNHESEAPKWRDPRGFSLRRAIARASVEGMVH